MVVTVMHDQYKAERYLVDGEAMASSSRYESSHLEQATHNAMGEAQHALSAQLQGRQG